MVSIMVPAQLPSTCYVDEIAYWLAVGRVPGYYYDNPEVQAEAREDFGGFIERGGPIETMFYGFEPWEFSSILGIEVDYDRYFRAKECAIYGGDGALHRATVESQIARLATQLDPGEIDTLRAETAKEADEIDWSLSLDARFQPLVDAARAEVFLALHKGELSALGWPSAAPEDPTDEQLKESVSLFPIPAAAWTQTNFDWGKSSLRCHHPEGEFHAVQVRTEEMFAKFPSPTLLANSENTIALYPTCGIISESQRAPERRRPLQQRPGAPPHGNLTHQDVVNNYVKSNPPPDLSTLPKSYWGPLQRFMEQATGKTIPPQTIRDQIVKALRSHGYSHGNFERQLGA